MIYVSISHVYRVLRRRALIIKQMTKFDIYNITIINFLILHNKNYLTILEIRFFGPMNVISCELRINSFCHNSVIPPIIFTANIFKPCWLKCNPVFRRSFLIISSLQVISLCDSFSYVIVSPATCVANLLSVLQMGLDNAILQLGSFYFTKHFNWSNLLTITVASVPTALFLPVWSTI